MQRVLDAAAGPFGWIVGVGGGILVVICMICFVSWVFAQIAKFNIRRAVRSSENVQPIRGRQG